MRVKNILLTLCIAGASTAYGTPKQVTQAGSSLVFVENKGQITDQHNQPRTDIDFRIGGSGVNLFVGSTALHYQWVQPAGIKVIAGDTLQEFTTYRMDVELVGANPNAQVIKEQKQNFYERYYTSPFGEQGATAYSYEKVTYKEIYPNIDWVLYVRNNTIEYDFVLRPGGKVPDIQLQYAGATKLAINKDGSLTATTPFGTLTEAAPFTFQQSDGKTVVSKFALKNNTLGFSTGDYKGTLVIDPVLQWATYYGGAMDENMNMGSIDGDNAGNVYLSGFSNSTNNIATTGSHQATHTGLNDGFLSKFNANGTLVWSTYYGGTGQDYGMGVAYDTTGSVFVVGYSNSTSGIATTGSYQAALAGSTDAFIVKFDSTGLRQWASYYGGSSADQGLAIALDRSHNAYITGYTSSTSNIAAPGSHQTTRGGGQDAFLAKFSSSGNLVWSTYYGGSAADNGLALSTDSSNNIYLGGYTRSTADIATTGAYQAAFNGLDDGFVAKFDSMGVRQWGTYFGGNNNEKVYAICSDGLGHIYIAGYTYSTHGIATAGSHQNTLGGVEDGFIGKFGNSGNLVWATYYGGVNGDGITGVQCSGVNSVYIAGYTKSPVSIATIGAFKDTLGGAVDGMIARFDTSGNRVWGTYFGGDGSDYSSGLLVTPLADLYITGTTSSISDLSTSGSYQSVMGGGNLDAYLAKFNVCELTAPAAIAGADTVCPASTHTYAVPAVAGAVSYTWILPNSWSGTSSTNSINVQAGTATDTIRVAAIFLCGTSDTIIKVITVYALPAINPSGAVALCAGDSITLTASTGTAYQWLLAGTAISGAINNEIIVASAGSYSVVVNSVNGCTDTSLTTDITINPLPVPVITASGSELSTGTYSSYQWNHNGSPITGAINATYTVTLNTGTYTVTVADANGCTGTSEPYTPATGIHEANGKSYSISIYPNPANHTLYVETNNEVNISLQAVDGRYIADYKSSKVIDISELPEGFYLLYITDKNGLFIGTEKFVKAL